MCLFKIFFESQFRVSVHFFFPLPPSLSLSIFIFIVLLLLLLLLLLLRFGHTTPQKRDQKSLLLFETIRESILLALSLLSSLEERWW